MPSFVPRCSWPQDESMDPAEYSWRNQSNLVSSLDLLEEEVLREVTYGPQWNRDKHLLVEGEPAITVLREVSRISPRKPSVAPKTSSRRRPSASRGGDRCANNAEDGPRMQLQLENERLQHEIMQWQREVEHTRDEKLELEASFRRLDQEIGNGYHLAERKEKELRIAELVTKNQKMSQLLEKELQSHEELRREHAEVQGDQRKLGEQVALLNQVLDSVETKHAELSSSHETLTASYEAAQTTIETLQCEVHVLQDKLASADSHVQVVSEYEEKLQHWERICRDLERKCEHKRQKLAQTQQIASASQQEAQRALHRQEELEQEVRNAHDEMIRINAAMRTMEAKLEGNLKAAQHGGSQASLHRRIRQLEGELLQKNRTNAELMQACNQLLGSQKRTGDSKASLSNKNNHAMTSRVAKLTTRVASLTDKLHITEEVRDQKSRSLDVLTQAFPFLLQRLDALQDRFAAAVESNDIIKSALEQMQDPPNAGPGWIRPSTVYDPSVSGSAYLHLAREKYLLEAPYPVELLADLTGAQALSGRPDTTTSFSGAKKKRFPPFRVKCSTLKVKDNQREEESNDQIRQLVVLSADSNDVSGAAYLNRSKINAFLELIQSSATREKFKTLVIGKLADCLNKLRELAHRSASESAAQQASIQLLQREVAELHQRLKNGNYNGSINEPEGETAMTLKSSQEVYRTRQFLLKMVDVYAEKQQENDHRQMTFLTQPLSSDMLITKAHTSHNENSSAPDDRLGLIDCGLDDDDVGQLLLKVMVSGARFREIILDMNNVSDVGAHHVADFLEKPSTGIRVVSLAGNKRITRRGVELIKRGLLRNHRVQRVQEDHREQEGRVILRGLAIEQDFDVSGNATEILCVILPIVSNEEEVVADLKMTAPEAADAMTEKLRQLGFRYNIRHPSRQRSSTYSNQKHAASLRSDAQPRSSFTASAVRRASLPSSTRTNFSRITPVANGGKSNTSRRRSVPSSSEADSQRQQIKQQQDLRFQSLEAAIRRASDPHLRHQVNRTLTSTPLISRPSSSRGVNGNTISRSNKRAVGKTHMNTIRGLRR